MREQGGPVGDIIWFAIRYLIALFLTALVFVAALFIFADLLEDVSNGFGPTLLVLLFAVFLIALAGYYGYAAARQARGGTKIGLATGITVVAIVAGVEIIATVIHSLVPSAYVARAWGWKGLEHALFSMLFGAWVVLAFTIGGYVHGRWPTKRPPVQPAAEPDDRDVLFALGWAWPTRRRAAPQDDDEELDDLDPDWIFRTQLYLKYGRYADETDDLNNTPSAQR